MKINSKVLIIAGSDSSGGAGIQADIKSVTSLGSYAMTAITAVTAQNTKGVKSIVPIPIKEIYNQIEFTSKDIKSDSVKIGMLHSKQVINLILKSIKKFKLKKIVLDPVMVAKGGTKLIDDAAVLVSPTGKDTVISVDTSIEGVHFLKSMHASDIAYRAVSIALSDLAACGALPAWFTLALSLNQLETKWLSDFRIGLEDISNELKNNLNLYFKLLKEIKLNKDFFVKDLRKSIFFYGRDQIKKIFIINSVANKKKFSLQNNEILSKINNVLVPKFPVTGNDLLKKGVQRGNKIGDTLKKIERKWIENNFQINDEEINFLIKKNI